MTNKNYTALVFIIDRSGSMDNIHKEVTGALNGLVQSEAAEPGKLTIDTVFFDHEYEARDSFASPDSVDLTIVPKGMTALHDAVGRKILSFGQALSELPEEERPGKVLFIIATDGFENSSHEFTAERVGQLVEHQKTVYDWGFTFLGANQDAVLTAKTLNIAEGDAITFDASAAGVQNVGASLRNYTNAYRSGATAGYTVEDRASAMTIQQPDLVPASNTGRSWSNLKRTSTPSVVPEPAAPSVVPVAAEEEADILVAYESMRKAANRLRAAIVKQSVEKGGTVPHDEVLAQVDALKSQIKLIRAENLEEVKAAEVRFDRQKKVLTGK